MQPVSKFQSIQAAILADDFKKAFGIARKFFFGFTSEEKRCIEIAADALNGRASFYATLGVDVGIEVEAAKALLRSKYVI